MASDPLPSPPGWFLCHHSALTHLQGLRSKVGLGGGGVGGGRGSRLQGWKPGQKWTFPEGYGKAQKLCARHQSQVGAVGQAGGGVGRSQVGGRVLAWPGFRGCTGVLALRGKHSQPLGWLEGREPLRQPSSLNHRVVPPGRPLLAALLASGPHHFTSLVPTPQSPVSCATDTLTSPGPQAPCSCFPSTCLGATAASSNSP